MDCAPDLRASVFEKQDTHEIGHRLQEKHTYMAYGLQSILPYIQTDLILPVTP